VLLTYVDESYTDDWFTLDPPTEFLVDHRVIKISFVDLFVGVGMGDPLVCPAFPLWGFGRVPRGTGGLVRPLAVGRGWW